MSGYQHPPNSHQLKPVRASQPSKGDLLEGAGIGNRFLSVRGPGTWIESNPPLRPHCESPPRGTLPESEPQRWPQAADAEQKKRSSRPGSDSVLLERMLKAWIGGNYWLRLPQIKNFRSLAAGFDGDEVLMLQHCLGTSRRKHLHIYPRPIRATTRGGKGRSICF